MEKMRLPPSNPLTPSSPEEELRLLREVVSDLSARVSFLETLSSSRDEQSQRVVPANLPKRPSQKFESRFGLTLVNRAGALTLAIGIIFFFKYAADNKWIDAQGRVSIGVILGLSMLAASEWMQRRQRKVSGPDQTVFIQGITGCGLAVIYVSLYACFAYYDLIVPLAGWSLLVLVSAFAVLLSFRYNSLAIAALGFVGALLTPMLLHNAATAWWFDLLYLFLLNITALAVAIRQAWLLLIPGLAALTVLSAAVLFYSPHPVSFAILLSLLAAAHFAGSTVARTSPRLASFAYLTAHACLLLAAMRLVGLFATANSSPENRASFISALDSLLLAVYGIAALLYGMAKKAFLDRALGLFLLSAMILKLYVWDVWQLDRFYRISAFVLLGILLLAASYLYSRFRNRAS